MLSTFIESSATGMRYEWNRLHTINVYDWRGNNVDCFSLDYSVTYPDIGMVYSAISRYES